MRNPSLHRVPSARLDKWLLSESIICLLERFTELPSLIWPVVIAGCQLYTPEDRNLVAEVFNSFRTQCESRLAPNLLRCLSMGRLLRSEHSRTDSSPGMAHQYGCSEVGLNLVLLCRFGSVWMKITQIPIGEASCKTFRSRYSCYNSRHDLTYYCFPYILYVSCVITCLRMYH